MIPLDQPKVPGGYTLVDRATRKRINSALQVMIDGFGHVFATDVQTVMTRLRAELFNELFSATPPAELMLLSDEEFNVATLALVIQAGFTFIPVSDVTPSAHRMRRWAAAGLLSLHPLALPEDRAAHKAEDLEYIRYLLRDLGVDEVKAFDRPGQVDQ